MSNHKINPTKQMTKGFTLIEHNKILSTRQIEYLISDVLSDTIKISL